LNSVRTSVAISLSALTAILAKFFCGSSPGRTGRRYFATALAP
jgi:hypothetical protein